MKTNSPLSVIRKNTLLPLLLCAVLHAHAQRDQQLSTPVKRAVGKFEDGRMIEGTTFYWSESLRDVHVDTGRKEVILHLVNFQTGAVKLAVFDAQGDTFKWTRSFRPLDVYNFTFGPDHIIYNQGTKATCYDRTTGDKRWHVRETVPFADPELPIAVSKRGNVYDLSSGTVKSRRNISNTWRDLARLGDDVAIVASAGIHYMHLSTGGGWDFVPPITEGKHDDLRSSSNILIEDDRIYFASCEGIYCLNTSGKVIWQQRFPENTGSTATITWHEQYVNIISYGIDYEGNWTGVPFIAGFHKDSGKQKYFQSFELEQRIIDPYIGGSSMIVYARGVIQQYNLYTGEKTIEKKTKGSKLEQYDEIVRPDLCVINKDGRFESVAEFYPDSYFLMNKAGNIYRTDGAFEPIEIIESKNWWKLYQRIGDVQFIRGNDESLMIKNNKRFAALKTTSAFIMGDKIVDITEHEIKTIKTSRLLQ